MADHSLALELFYDGGWHAAPVYVRGGCKVKRGTSSLGNDTDPASAAVMLDNRSGNYSPRSLASSLYGKIGQNTKTRFTVDGSVRLTGEAAAWRPERAEGDAWCNLSVAGVLQRLGRGVDPLRTPLYRSYTLAAAPPVAYWPLEGGATDTTVLYDAITGQPTDQTDQSAGVITQTGGVRFGSAVLGDGSEKVADIAGSYTLVMKPPSDTAASNTVSMQWAMNFGTPTRAAVPFTTRTSLRFNPATATRHLYFTTYVNDDGTASLDVSEATSDFIPVVGPTTIASGLSLGNVFDGQPRAFQLDLTASGASGVAWRLWANGTSLANGTYASGITGPMNAAPYQIDTLSFLDRTESLAVGHFAIFTGALPASRYSPLTGYTGETAADRFTRLCTEQGITPTVVGVAADSLLMGPQRAIALLDLLDEIGSTDDASIFETRGDTGLTMRTGASRLNQAPALTISYLGQVQPPLLPVVGDEGVRNDVTASNLAGVTRRVQQLTGPHNIQLPEDDPQGVGRYQTRADVNPATEAALNDAAGWRVNLGTFDGTWYAQVTADLDAAPSITTAVNALDIGDVLALSNLPADEALGTVEGLIIGIEEDVQPKRRTVTFLCVPAEPYRVGILANTAGDTDPFLGHLDTDGSTTVGSTSVGATSFSVATPSGPLWTVDADDFPQDVIVGGQRVSISSVSGAASPQTFNVRSAALGGLQIAYLIPAGSAVNVHHPIILTQ